MYRALLAHPFRRRPCLYSDNADFARWFSTAWDGDMKTLTPALDSLRPPLASLAQIVQGAQALIGSNVDVAGQLPSLLNLAYMVGLQQGLREGPQEPR